MNTKHSIHKLSKQFIWITLALLLFLVSCSVSGSIAEPTAIVYPTAAMASTSPPSQPTLPPPPTEEPTQESPKAEIVNVSAEAVEGNPVVINYIVENQTGLSAVELTLNSADGEVIAFDRADDLKTATGEVGYESTWIPDKPGEYTLYLTAYDLEKNPSASDTITITVSPRVSVEFTDVPTEVVAGNLVDIGYMVYIHAGTAELSAVEVALNSVDGEVIAYDRAAEDLKKATGEIGYGSPWTPNKSGEHTLYLIAYDMEKNPVAQDTVIITVSPRVSVEIVDIPAEAIVGKPVDIELSVKSNTGTGFSSVELTLNSVDGEYIFFDRAEDLKTTTDKIGYGVTWTPNKPGEYTLYLTAYDLQGLPSGTATVKITVAPSP